MQEKQTCYPLGYIELWHADWFRWKIEAANCPLLQQNKSWCRHRWSDAEDVQHQKSNQKMARCRFLQRAWHVPPELVDRSQAFSCECINHKTRFCLALGKATLQGRTPSTTCPTSESFWWQRGQKKKNLSFSEMQKQNFSRVSILPRVDLWQPFQRRQSDHDFLHILYKWLMTLPTCMYLLMTCNRCILVAAISCFFYHNDLVCLEHESIFWICT